jgi:iron complex transport system substrate-binding protein
MVPLLALALAGCAAPERAPGTGGGIVSTNPCADAILIDLVPAGRIAAISHYSQDPGASSIPLDVSRRFRSTAGTAEEVIALRPDLVLTSSFTPASTRNAYARAGLKTLVLDSPTTIDASKAQIAQVAAAVGAGARGKALIARIDRAVAEAAPQGPDRPPALLFIAGDLASGSGNLLDELLHRSGFRNAAADYGLAFTGTIPIETIAAHPPRVILAPDTSRTALLRRRVLDATGARVTEAAFPRNLVNCGGPTIIPAIGRLAEIRRALDVSHSLAKAGVQDFAGRRLRLWTPALAGERVGARRAA